MKKVIGLLVCIGLLAPVFSFGEEEGEGEGMTEDVIEVMIEHGIIEPEISAQWIEIPTERIPIEVIPIEVIPTERIPIEVIPIVEIPTEEAGGRVREYVIIETEFSAQSIEIPLERINETSLGKQEESAGLSEECIYDKDIESIVIGKKDDEKWVICQKPNIALFLQGDNIDKNRDISVLYKEGYIVEYEIIDRSGNQKYIDDSLDVFARVESEESEIRDLAKKYYTSIYEEILKKFKCELRIKSSVLEEGDKLICTTYKKVYKDGDKDKCEGKSSEADRDGSEGGVKGKKDNEVDSGYKDKDYEKNEIRSRTFQIVEPGLKFFTGSNFALTPIFSFELGKKDINGNGSTGITPGIGASYMLYYESEKHKRLRNIMFGVNLSYSNTKNFNEETQQYETARVTTIGLTCAYRLNPILLQIILGFNKDGDDTYFRLSFGFINLMPD